MNNKCYGYIRVSTSDQDNSLEVQEKRIKEYCLFKHLDLIEIIVDENISGFKQLDKRPGGNKLNSLIQGNTKIIVTIKPDRLFRNTVDAITTVDTWNSQNIVLHIVDMGGATIDTTSATGKMIFTVLIAFSQFERDITGERTKAILNNKKSTKKVYSGPILGFDNINGQLIPNKNEQETIKTILNLSKRFAPNRISRILNNTGFRTKSLKPFHPSTIQYILKNPIYNEI